MGSSYGVLHLPSLSNETYTLCLSWNPPGGWCTFPNVGKAACAQVRERDSASNAQRITNTYTCSFKTRQSHRRQQWPACTCVWAEGKRDPIGLPMTHRFCDCCRNTSPAQPWEITTAPDTRWGGTSQGEDEGPGGTLHVCQGNRSAGGRIPTGPPGGQGVGGRAFPDPNK